jgi:hypothetical protein
LHNYSCSTCLRAINLAVDTQNLTIKLPVDTIRRAKIIAAERGTSISALVAEKIEEAIGEDAEYQAARRRAVQWLEQGWHLGGRP